MSDQQFDVFFRGDIVAGQSVGDVKERLAGLFKLEAAKVEQLFSGRPTAIRRNLDEAGAKKYEQALLKIGAIAELRPVKVDAPAAEAVTPAPVAAKRNPFLEPAKQAPVATPASLSEPAEQPAADGGDMSLAPVGSDVLRPDERSNVAATDIDVSALALEPGGGEILHADEKQSVEATQVDTSHLEVLPPS
ncbi:MAG: hypothetical protein COA75_00595 [Cellvibrionales bacterium]|nr:MAG: hypothetical protein COA75_00595 [Cellvibrionales bacterium]